MLSCSNHVSICSQERKILLSSMFLIVKIRFWKGLKAVVLLFQALSMLEADFVVNGLGSTFCLWLLVKWVGMTKGQRRAPALLLMRGDTPHSPQASSRSALSTSRIQKAILRRWPSMKTFQGLSGFRTEIAGTSDPPR